VSFRSVLPLPDEALEESLLTSDVSPTQLAEFDPSRIYFKDDPRWLVTYHSVSVALARDHPSRS